MATASFGLQHVIQHVLPSGLNAWTQMQYTAFVSQGMHDTFFLPAQLVADIRETADRHRAVIADDAEHTVLV